MSTSHDVIILGGGVIGCAIAFELSGAGLSVTLLEKGDIAGEASSAAAGLLVPLHAAEAGRHTPLFELYLQSTQCFPNLVPLLEEETGLRLDYDPAGSIRVALGNAEAERLQQEFQAWKQVDGLNLEWLDKNTLLGLEPNLAPTVTAGILSHDEKSIDPGKLTRAFARAAIQKGAKIRTGCPVTGVQHTHGRFEAVQTPEGDLSGGALVIAAGAWSRTPCRWFGLDAPIGPARGQMLSLRSQSRPLTRSIFSYHGGLYPRFDGTVYVGSSVEHAGFDKSNTPEALSRLTEMVDRLTPSLNAAPIDRIWAGLRPECADGLPVIGRLPGYKNVTVASGHFKMGITGSPLTARLIKRLLVDNDADPLLQAFSPERFTS